MNTSRDRRSSTFRARAWFFSLGVAAATGTLVSIIVMRNNTSLEGWAVEAFASLGPFNVLLFLVQSKHWITFNLVYILGFAVAFLLQPGGA